MPIGSMAIPGSVGGKRMIVTAIHLSIYQSIVACGRCGFSSEREREREREREGERDE